MAVWLPMGLLRIPDPFDHPEFLFEPKLDGFRALAHISRRNSSDLKSLQPSGRKQQISPSRTAFDARTECAISSDNCGHDLNV